MKQKLAVSVKFKISFTFQYIEETLLKLKTIFYHKKVDVTRIKTFRYNQNIVQLKIVI